MSVIGLDRFADRFRREAGSCRISSVLLHGFFHLLGRGFRLEGSAGTRETEVLRFVELVPGAICATAKPGRATLGEADGIIAIGLNGPLDDIRRELEWSVLGRVLGRSRLAFHVCRESCGGQAAGHRQETERKKQRRILPACAAPGKKLRRVHRNEGMCICEYYT